MKHAKWLIFLLILFTLTGCISNIFPRNLNNLMLSCPKYSNYFTYINYNTFETKRIEQIDPPDSLSLYATTISYNKDFLICLTFNKVKNTNTYAMLYDLHIGKISKIFPIDPILTYNQVLFPSIISSEPETFYLYSTASGLFKINYSTETSEMLQPVLPRIKSIFQAPSENWTIISRLTYFDFENNKDFTELEIYDSANLNGSPQFVLNNNNCDSVNVHGAVYSELKDKLFISYIKSSEIEGLDSTYFGSYDISSRELDPSIITLPWVNNNPDNAIPYRIAYNDNFDECYMLGTEGNLYIIDVSSDEYAVLDTISMPEYKSFSIDLKISPDKNSLFVYGVVLEKIIIIDLINREIDQILDVETPHTLFYL